MPRRTAKQVDCPAERIEAIDESVKNDIAVAERLRITATTLDGILTVKGQGRRNE